MSRRGPWRAVRVVGGLLFPASCVGCGERLAPYAPTDTAFCPLCRSKWEQALAAAREKQASSPTDKHIYGVDYHSGRTDGVPERFIYHLKHKGEGRAFRLAARVLAPRVTRAVEAVRGEEEVPVLVAYPPRRAASLRRDGFDQARELARALAGACGYTFSPLLTRRIRPAAAQKTLSARERQANAALSYALRMGARERVRGAVVLLCDDVCTTGATLQACSLLLAEEGARAVLWVTVGRTASGSS